jgi:FkbM family methyltransferase
MSTALKIAVPPKPRLAPLDPPFGAYAPNAAQAAIIRLVRKSFLRRGVFRHSMSRFASALRAGPLDTTFRGARFRIQLDATSTEWALLFHPRYNGPEIEFLAEALRPGSIFVDIGANIGLYSLPLALLTAPAGSVIAIEPDARALSRLRANQAASRATNLIIFPVAAGAKAGEIGFTHAANSGASRVCPQASQRVRVRPLTEIISEAGVGRIDALKIDVEGYEDRALLPFFRSAPRNLWPARMVVENEYAREWNEDCLEFLTDIGYRTVALTRNNVLLVFDGTSARTRGARFSVVAANDWSACP